MKLKGIHIILFYFLFFSFSNYSFGQVSYLGLDGGFEGSATIDNSTTNTSAQSGKWVKANTTQTIANETSTVRSGTNSLKITNSTTTGRRVWSPLITVSSTTTSVTIQYYRYVTNTTNTQENQEAVTRSGTEDLQGTYDVPASTGTWEKQTYSPSSRTFTDITGELLTKQKGTGGSMFLDDMCIYTGGVDNTAPNTASSPLASNPNLNSIDISWTAASGGVDGGGYLVVRGTTDPTNAPNSNGIYAVNNLIAAGMTVVYNGTGTSFTDNNGLASGTTYYYRIYTYDKAYNYSSATSCNGTTTCATPTSTYFYRTKTSGNWSNVGTWEASPDGTSGWINACSIPTNASPLITIQNGHTVTIDANATATDITVNFGGTLQANSSAFVSLTISGNLINNGIFQMVNGAFGSDVYFNKNGNQSITGTGGTTNFYSLGLNMGTSNANILDISPTNFSFYSPLFQTKAYTNALLNGTCKFSGTALCSGSLFSGTGAIPASAGIWVNNPNITINGSGGSYDLSGKLKVSSGILNIGNGNGNSLRLLASSSCYISGGTVNIAGRLQAMNSSGTAQNNVTYNQSGGVVNISSFGANGSASISEFDFERTSDSVIISGGTIVFKNQSTQVDDIFHYGTSLITGGTFQIADASSTTFDANGFLITSGSALPSIYIYKPAAVSPIVYLNDNLNVVGDITISNGTIFNNSFAATPSYSSSYDIALTGNFKNDGTFTSNNFRAVNFKGTSAQTISGSTTTTFNNLKINNSSGGVTLQTPSLVRDSLTLTKGIVYTDATNLLTMNAGSSATGAKNSSFISGPIAKIGTTDFVFPVGKDTVYRPISATTLSASETFTAEYFNYSANALYDVSLKDASLDHLSICEYWILNRAGSANANVTLSWDYYWSCGVSSLPDLSIARWNGTIWKDQGNGGTTGDTLAGTIITNGLVTSFSPFTLSSTLSTVNPLPIELISFTATCNSNNTVDLKWITASEINNDYFTIERSSDAVNFEKVLTRNGAGNSHTTLTYTDVDNEPLQGVSYYRLKQTDYNGDYKYSNIVSLNRNECGGENNELAIINTTTSAEQGNLEVIVNTGYSNILNIELFDMLGKKVYSSIQKSFEQIDKINIPLSNISGGIYMLKISNQSKLISKKIKL